MWSNFQPDKNAESGTIEVSYATCESEKIRKCVCVCYCPWKNQTKTANCIFYDSDDNLVAEIEVPNDIIYCRYLRGDAPALCDNGKAIILSSCVKDETACYSLESKKILWTCPLKDISDIFVCGIKVYAFCIHSKSKGSLQLINSKTGEPIKELLTYSTKMNHPSFYRLSERYLLVYITERFFVYNMETDEFLVTRVKHKGLFDYELCRLEKVLPTNNSDEVSCCFADFFSTYDERGIIAKAEWQKSEVIVKISDLLDGAKPSPFGNKIPTDKKTLEKAQ